MCLPVISSDHQSQLSHTSALDLFQYVILIHPSICVFIKLHSSHFCSFFSCVATQPYEGLRPQDLRRLKDMLIVETADMLQAPLFTAEALLRAHGTIRHGHTHTRTHAQLDKHRKIDFCS